MQSSCSHDVILGRDFLSCHNAVIDCAWAELELFKPQRDVSPFNSTCSGETKLVFPEDVNIPLRSSALVAHSCNARPDRPALSTPSDLFARPKNLPLPFAVLTLRWSEHTTMLITNLTDHPVSLLHSETTGQIKPAFSASTFAMTPATNCPDLIPLHRRANI